MKRLLVGWELGAGRGHLEMMKPLIDAAIRSDWKVIAAVRDVRTAASILTATPIAGSRDALEIIQAPIFSHIAAPRRVPPVSLADILAHIGFNDPVLVRPVVEGWRRLLADVRPDVILADATPSLVAASIGKLPVIMTGNGWTIPPDGERAPLFPHLIAGYTQNARAEEGIIAAFRYCGISIDRTSSLLRGDATFVFTPAVLDPYRAMRAERVWWPPNIAAEPAVARSTGRIALYLPARHPALNSTIAALEDISADVLAYFGGRSPPVPRNLKVSRTPFDLGKLLPYSQFVIHHGGLGIASWSIAAGIPQLAIPADLEKRTIGRAIEESNLGIAVNSPASLASRLRQVQRLQLQPSDPRKHGVRETIDAVMTAIDHAL